SNDDERDLLRDCSDGGDDSVDDDPDDDDVNDDHDGDGDDDDPDDDDPDDDDDPYGDDVAINWVIAVLVVGVREYGAHTLFLAVSIIRALLGCNLYGRLKGDHL
ncbi:hypothetical protein Tco_0547350, partial [Tanacetum coccineum]